MRVFTSYVVTELGAKVAPLPKSVLRFGEILIIGTGAFLVARGLDPESTPDTESSAGPRRERR
jgi:hypothetical protein